MIFTGIAFKLEKVVSVHVHPCPPCNRKQETVSMLKYTCSLQ